MSHGGVPDYVRAALPFVYRRNGINIDRDLLSSAISAIGSGRMSPHQYLGSLRESHSIVELKQKLLYYSKAAHHAGIAGIAPFHTPKWPTHAPIHGTGALPGEALKEFQKRSVTSDRLMESLLPDKSGVICGDATFKVAKLARFQAGRAQAFDNMYTLMSVRPVHVCVSLKCLHLTIARIITLSTTLPSPCCAKEMILGNANQLTLRQPRDWYRGMASC